jgi:hypothetical protein
LKTQIYTTACAVALCGLWVTSAATDYPKRKPGLWELTRNSPNPRLPPQVEQICLDAATDALLYRFGNAAGHSMCSKVDIHTAGTRVTVDSICTIGSSQITTHDIISFSGDSAYHEDVTLHYDPPLLGKTADSQVTKDARWVGACSAGMKPGDIVTKTSPLSPVPFRMNIVDMLKDSH